MFTYVRTEVNYTEEVDDPVDSDGEQNAFTANTQHVWMFAPVHKDLLNLVMSLTDFCRWGSGFWESGVQHLWVCPHAAGEQQVQEHSEEGSTWTHLLHHPVHADHWGPGEDWPEHMRLLMCKYSTCIHCDSLFLQIKVWTANPQQFVEDEDDDTFSYSVRISAQDLLLVR